MTAPGDLLVSFDAEGDYGVLDLATGRSEFHFTRPYDAGASLPGRFSPADVQAIADAVAERISARPARDGVPPVLIGREEAARMLGITVKALDARVTRGQVPGLVRTGRRVQFAMDVLREKTAKRAR